MNNVTLRRKKKEEEKDLSNKNLSEKEDTHPNMADSSGLEKKIDSLLEGFSDMRNKVGNIEKSVNFMSEQFDSINSEIKKHGDKISNLNDRNVALEKSLINAHCRIRSLEQQAMASHVIVSGLPESRGEDTGLVICTLLGKMNICEPNPVVRSYRLGRFENGRIRPILAEMSSSQLAVLASDSSRKLKPTAKLLSQQFSDRRIFVAEGMTPDTRLLWGAARKRISELKYSYIWFRRGIIQVRQAEGKPAITIRSNDDLEGLS